MDDFPLVSFCMSTYKRPDILLRQIKGILLQKYKNFEILISDNDPEASAGDAISELSDPRIKYFCNGTNLGMVKSFNQSIARSSGRYIIMITDDDPVYPDMIETLMKVREKYPGYGVYAGCGDWIVETEFSSSSLGEKVGIKKTGLKNLPENYIILSEADKFVEMYFDGVFANVFLLWSCAMVERSVIEEVKGMPDYGSELLTDHAYIIATASKKGFIYVNKGLGGQSIRGDNFGFNFQNVKEKYVTTPGLFFNYLRPHLENFDNWHLIQKKLWNFIGRGWVEYSLMIYRSLKGKNSSKAEFFRLLNNVFNARELKKWKYKFYLKAYFGGFFKFLLLFKQK